MRPDELRIDPDLRFATTPPAALYGDAWFPAVAERVFRPAWHLVATAEEIAAKETVLPRTLLPGVLDEPVVLTRDRKERLHCLSNACTHRGSAVASAAGPAKLLRCPFHDRQFRLDGELLASPGFDDAIGFPSPSDSLPRLAVAAWGPLVFASVAPSAPFADVVEPLREQVPAPEDLRVAAAGERVLRANWALWVESRLDAFGGAASRVLLFPASVVTLREDGVVLEIAEPRSAGETLVRTLHLVRGGGSPAAGFTPDMSRDAALESAQEGNRSHLRRSGPYSPSAEAAVHRFHLRLAAALAP